MIIEITEPNDERADKDYVYSGEVEIDSTLKKKRRSTSNNQIKPQVVQVRRANIFTDR